VHEVKIDVNKSWLVFRFSNDVLIPDLFKHGFAHVRVTLRKKTNSLTSNKSEQK